MDGLRMVRALLALTLALPWTAAAHGSQGKGHGKGHDKPDNHDSDRDDDKEDRRGTGYAFGPRDRDTISGYYRNRYSNLPPGLAKRNGNLPPGLAKQLRRNGTLPPGLQKRVEPFPPDLIRQLRPLPSYYSRGVIGDQAIILDERTRAIVDVIDIIMHPKGR